MAQGTVYDLPEVAVDGSPGLLVEPHPSASSPSRGDGLRHLPVLRPRLVIIGNGMVSHRLCETLLRLAPGHHQITVFGEESRPAYDRVHLGDVLRGRDAESLSLAPRHWYHTHAIDLRLADPVISVDLKRRTVMSTHGVEVAYDKLVIATGSSPLMPAIPVDAWDRVFVLRTMEDVQRVRAAADGGRSAVIIGGGLLGLETASTLRESGMALTIVERSDGLMSRQLDPAGSSLLRRRLEALGITIRLGTTVSALRKGVPGLRVSLTNGAELTTDLVVVSIGVRPRDNLSVWGLQTAAHGGYAINQHLQTSDPNVYAIGECASLGDTLTGLVSPGYAMAESLARSLLGRPTPFQPSCAAVRLKISDLPVGVAGSATPPQGTPITWQGRGGYRSLYLKDGSIERAVAVGTWPEWEQVEDAVRRHCPLTPAQLRRFARGQVIFPKPAADTPPPSEMIVCSCNNVTAGALQAAIGAGCQTLPMLADRTHASTTCGACIPRLEQLLHIDRKPRRAEASMLLAAVGVLALLAVALVVGGRALLTVRLPRGLPTLPALPNWDQVWRQPAQQQLTGFVLLGLVLLPLIYPLRARLGLAPRLTATLRLVHAVLGTVALVAIVAHTGLRLGVNGNRWLSIAFLLLAGLGSLASFRRRSGTDASGARGRWRRAVAAVHGLLLWPALALIGVHILAVYYF